MVAEDEVLRLSCRLNHWRGVAGARAGCRHGWFVGRRIRAEHRSAADLEGNILVEFTLPPSKGDSHQGDQNQPQFPGAALLGERIEEIALSAWWQFRNVRERCAEGNVDPGAGVDRPSVCIKNRAEVA